VGQRLLARIRDEARGGEFVKEVTPVRLVVGKSARSTA
jgi:hypothetical protein